MVDRLGATRRRLVEMQEELDLIVRSMSGVSDVLASQGVARAKAESGVADAKYALGVLRSALDEAATAAGQSQHAIAGTGVMLPSRFARAVEGR